MSSPILPFLNNLPNWEDIVKSKHLLFDNDAIVSILSYKAESLLDRLKSLNVTNCYIHPVYSELLATEKPASRAYRQAIFSQYNFQLLPLIKNDFNHASLIQTNLSNNHKFPSPTDLYLGGKIATLTKDVIYLLTSNLDDFQYPLFVRKGGIILQNSNQCKIISILDINRDLLIPF